MTEKLQHFPSELSEAQEMKNYTVSVYKYLGIQYQMMQPTVPNLGS